MMITDKARELVISDDTRGFMIELLNNCQPTYEEFVGLYSETGMPDESVAFMWYLLSPIFKQINAAGDERSE